MPIVVCKQCGKEFYAKPNRVSQGMGIFCSRSCAADDRKIKRKCMWCGNLFSGDRRKTFCSRSCASFWNHAKSRGIKVKLYQGQATLPLPEVKQHEQNRSLQDACEVLLFNQALLKDYDRWPWEMPEVCGLVTPAMMNPHYADCKHQDDTWNSYYKHVQESRYIDDADDDYDRGYGDA